MIGIKEQLMQMAGSRATIQAQLNAARSNLETVRSEWQLDESARIVGVAITERTRQRVKNIFDGVGTAALQAVFGNDSSFSLEFDQTESQKRRAFFCVNAAGVAGDPTQKSGNSTEAVLSTMLRRAVIILHPELTNFLACDEPLDGIDVHKQPGMALIDREMVDMHGMQEIIVTHAAADEYAEQADIIIHVEKKDPYTSTVKVTYNEKEEQDRL